MMAMTDRATDTIEAKAAADVPPIRRNLNRLDQALTNLDMSFAGLVDRILPVLAPEMEDDMSKDANPSAPCSGVAASVQNLIEQADRLASRIEGISRRVEC